MSIVLGCGPAEASWDRWDFAFLSYPADESAPAAPPGELALGSSTDGRTVLVEPTHDVSSTEFAWSPEGDAIAYVAPMSDNDEGTLEGRGLWLAREGGREFLADLQPNYARALEVQGLSWAPSGDRLVAGMTTYEPQGVSSSGWHLLVIDLGEDSDGRVLDVWPDGRDVSWAPDGTMFVARMEDVTYDPDYNPVYGTSDLYIYDVVQLRETWLSEVNTDANERGASWSPEGDRIVYLSDASGGNEILLWSVDGGSPRRLATPPCAVHGVDWFADGMRLLARCSDGEAVRFAIIDAEDGTVLAWHEGVSSLPSPDGNRVFLAGGGGLQVLDLRSSNVMEIGHGSAPAWRPE